MHDSFQIDVVDLSVSIDMIVSAIIVTALTSLDVVNNQYYYVDNYEIDPFVYSNEINQPLEYLNRQSKQQIQFHVYLKFSILMNYKILST